MEYTAAGDCRFTVWAPEKERLILHLVYPEDKLVEMDKDQDGYFSVALPDIRPGARYYYRPEGTGDYPDPASFFQPEGVHKASQVIDHNRYCWQDGSWCNIPLIEVVLYELHTGTFTKEGTFEAIIPRLRELAEIGINAIELMPVVQFPGNRNWGYDGVYPYAVHNSYGGPEGLKRLVDACHQHGIAVLLDVVYNHLGPEGNYLGKFGPYFTDKYITPWGKAINYDGEWSDGVKDYFIGNILYWFEHYHIDGLRLDAIHTIFDQEAVTIWDIIHREVNALERKLGRTFHLIAESDINSPKVVAGTETGGLGFDAQWLDDFHHALYVLLDPAGRQRYEDFGRLEQLAKAYTDGFVHSGEYVRFRKRRHGASSAGVPGDRFVVFNQNHDQVGNRVGGERLCMLVDFERQKLAAAAIFLAPYIPMLFMGEEFAAETPFLYFVSHSDKDLVKAVREGRKKEFEVYNKGVEQRDPQSESTFNECILDWEVKKEGKHAIMLEWHKLLISLKSTHPVLRNFNKNDVRTEVIEEKGLVLHRLSGDGMDQLLCLFNFSDEPMQYTMPDHVLRWKKLIDSREENWCFRPTAIDPAQDTAAGGEIVWTAPATVLVYEG
jgi:maltooligosyltrehalose trehalohydrolase